MMLESGQNIPAAIHCRGAGGEHQHEGKRQSARERPVAGIAGDRDFNQRVGRQGQ
jgi:hypothetical protein